MGMTIAAAAPVNGAAVVSDALVDQHVKPASDADAALLAAYRLSAIDHLEQHTALSFQRRAWRLALDGFAPAIRLPRGPVGQVTAIRYLDPAGVAQVVTGWRVGGDMVMPSAGSAWPVTMVGEGVVTIDFTAGFVDLASEAASLQIAVLLFIRHLYDGGSEAVPAPIVALCRPYRVPVLA